MRCQSAAHEGLTASVRRSVQHERSDWTGRTQAGRSHYVFRLSIQPILLNAVDHFYGRLIDLSKQEKHRLEFITFMMAAFHLGELGPELWCCACLLGTGMDTGTLNRTVPSLVTPLFVLLWQVKVSAVKKGPCLKSALWAFLIICHKHRINMMITIWFYTNVYLYHHNV